MDRNKLERANILTRNLSQVDSLLYMLSNSYKPIFIGDSLFNLSKDDKEFNTKFKQLLVETQERLQKELYEL